MTDEDDACTRPSGCTAKDGSISIVFFISSKIFVLFHLRENALRRNTQRVYLTTWRPHADIAFVRPFSMAERRVDAVSPNGTGGGGDDDDRRTNNDDECTPGCDCTRHRTVVAGGRKSERSHGAGPVEHTPPRCRRVGPNLRGNTAPVAAAAIGGRPRQ